MLSYLFPFAGILIEYTVLVRSAAKPLTGWPKFHLISAPQTRKTLPLRSREILKKQLTICLPFYLGGSPRGGVRR